MRKLYLFLLITIAIGLGFGFGKTYYSDVVNPNKMIVQDMPGNIGTYPIDYYNSGATTTGGVKVFYLTDDKTSTGNALYPTGLIYVNASVNDPNANYTFGWSYNVGTKALTITAKVNLTTNVLASLVGTLVPVLAPPSTVPNGTVVFVQAVGN